MRPCTSSDTDPLTLPLLVAASDVDGQGVPSTRRVNPLGEATEKEEPPKEEPCPALNHGTQSVLLYEGMLRWTHAHQRPVLERQDAAELYAAKVATSPVEGEQRGDTFASKEHMPLSEEHGGQLHKIIPNTTARDTTLLSSACEESPLLERRSASPPAALHDEQGHTTVDTPGESATASQLQVEDNQVRIPAAFSPSPSPSAFFVMIADPDSEQTPPRRPYLTLLCCSCLAEAWRCCRRALSLCRDCNTAFWWMLSPLFLLFIWFCWHGVRALWKMGSGAPGHWLSPNEDNSLYDYGLVIDAGSHGSRLTIYSWKPRVFDPTHPFTGPVSFPKLRFHGVPAAALHTPVEVPSILGALIDQGTEYLYFRAHVPELRWSDFPLYLKATGGLRNMEQAARDNLMDTIRDYLESRECNPFRFERAWARVLAGEEEGVYGWLAVNSGRNSLMDDPANTTGALDLGGASAQITFSPTHTSVLEDLTLVRLGDRTIRLYSHSYLGYGWGDALRRVNAALAVEVLLQHIKANPRFVAENILTGRLRRRGPFAAESVWDLSARDHSTFSASGARPRSPTIETADFKVTRFAPPEKDRGGLHVLASRGGGGAVRGRFLAVGDKENVDGVRRAARENRAAAEKISKSITNTLSEEEWENEQTEQEKKSASRVESEYKKQAGAQPVTDKRWRRGKNGSMASPDNQWKRQAIIESASERLNQKTDSSVLTAHSAGKLARRRDTQTSAFRLLDDRGRSPKDHGAPPHEVEEREEETFTLFPVAPEGLPQWKGIDAEEKQMDREFSAESRQKQTPTVTPARQFFQKGQKTRGEAVTSRESGEDTAAAKKPKRQQGETTIRLKRHGVAAAAGAGRQANDNELGTQRHQPEKRKTARESSTEQNRQGGSEKAGGDGVAGGTKIVEEKRADASGATGTQAASVEGQHDIVFNVSHPCFPRGSVYEFSLPALSYPERRYYVDISVDKIAAYMRVAGYEERDIESVIKTLDPHAVDREPDAQDVRPSKAKHSAHRQEQQQQQMQQQQQPQQQQRATARQKGRELSATEPLLQKNISSQAPSGAGVVGPSRQQQQQQAAMRRLFGEQGISTPGEGGGLHKIIRLSTVKNYLGEEESRIPVAHAETVTGNVSQLNAHDQLRESFAQQEAETGENVDKERSFPAGAVVPAAAEDEAYEGEEEDTAAIAGATSALAGVHQRLTQEDPGEGVTGREELPNAAGGAPSLLLQQKAPANRSSASEAGAAFLAKHSQTQRDGAGGAKREESAHPGGRHADDEEEAATEGERHEDEERDGSGADEPPKLRPKVNIVARFIGTADFEACQARANKLFHKTLCFMNSCSFNGVYQPRLENSNFLAFGQYSKVHAAMGLPPHAPLSAFLEGAKKICGQRVGQLQLKRRLQRSSTLLYSKKSLEKLCWKAVWSYAMLHQGFGFPASSTRISFAPVAGSDAAAPTPEWAAGSMIAEVNSYPWEVPPETYEAPFHLASAFLIMSLILALVLYHEVHWMRKRLRQRGQRRTEENEDEGTASPTDGVSAEHWQEQEMLEV